MIGNRVLRQNPSGSFDFDPQLRSLPQDPAEISSSAIQPEDPEQDPLQQAMAQWRWQQQIEDIRQSLAYEAGTGDRARQLAAQFIANSADRSADGQPSLSEAERDAALKANIANSAPVEAGVDPGTIDAYNRAHEILSNRVDEELPPAPGETASPLAPNMRSRLLDAGDLEMAMRQRQGNALTESEAQADTSAPASSAGEAEKRLDATPPERFGINRNPGQGGFIDPTILSDIVDAGRRILKRGMDFAGWAGRMISRFGSKVAGYLGHAWNYIRQRPSLSQTAEEIRDSLVNGGNTRKSEPPATDEISADASPEAVAARAMDYLNRNFESLLKEYERRFGNNIDIDKARELFPEYSRSKEARTRYVQAVADPAWKLIDEYYRRKLNDPSIKTIAFTAGGAGSGKSAAEAQIASGEEAPLIFGTTLSNFEGGRRILQRAVNSGKRVVVYYVDRPFAGAWDSVIDRAVETGRPVSLAVAARQYANAPRVSQRLAALFIDKVKWKAIDNSRGKEEAVTTDPNYIWARPRVAPADLAAYAERRLKQVYEQRRATETPISYGLYRALGGS